MDAVIYELVMCAAFDCSKGGANGAANAEVYRRMEYAVDLVGLQKKAIKNKEMPLSTKSVSELEYEANVAVLRLRNHLDSAIIASLKRVYREEFREELMSLRSSSDHWQYDTAVIDEVITRMNQIFQEEELIS